MNYTVIFLDAARRDLAAISKPFQQQIATKISQLAANPRPQQAKPLVHAEGRWRLRVGDYRVVYRIFDDRLLVSVIQVDHRKDVYR